MKDDALYDYDSDDVPYEDGGSPRRSLSALSLHGVRKDAKVFDRLYGHAEIYRARRDDLKSSLQESRSVDVLSTSVRSQQSTPKTTPAKAAQMYRESMEHVSSFENMFVS
jgi:hypothetical protein